MSIHVVTIGATGTRLRATLLDADGEPVDLTDATVVARFTISDTDYDKSMTVADAEGGVVEYLWLSADFTPMDTDGADYPLQFRVTRSGLLDIFPCPKEPKGGTQSQLYDILRVRPAL